MPSKKKAEEEKRKMSASNRQSRLRGEKSTRNFDHQRARPGKKSSPTEKNPQRGGNLHRYPSPPIAIRHRKAPKAPQRRRRHPTYECRLQIPSLNAVFECCLPMSSSDAVFGFRLHVTVPGNREADAPSPAPTTACSLPGWDGCCPSCKASVAHR